MNKDKRVAAANSGLPKPPRGIFGRLIGGKVGRVINSVEQVVDIVEDVVDVLSPKATLTDAIPMEAMNLKFGKGSVDLTVNTESMSVVTYDPLTSDINKRISLALSGGYKIADNEAFLKVPINTFVAILKVANVLNRTKVVEMDLSNSGYQIKVIAVIKPGISTEPSSIHTFYLQDKEFKGDKTLLTSTNNNAENEE